MQVEQQHLLAFKYPFGEGARLVDLALLVQRRTLVKVVGRVDVQLALAAAAQHDADGVDIKIAVDLFSDFAHQLIHIKAREHRVGDGHQDAKVVALAAEQIVVWTAVDPALDLLYHDAHDLGEGVQALHLLGAPGPVIVTDKLAAAEDLPLCRQRQQPVVAKGGVKVTFRKLRPGRAKILVAAVQRLRAGENAAHRAVGQGGFILVLDGRAVRTRGVVAGPAIPGAPENNAGAIRQR